MHIQRKKIVLAVSLALSLSQQSAFAQFEPSFELSGINGQNGVTINGIGAGDSSGTSVSTVGDVNGDGIDDLIIGALTADSGSNMYSGSSYVVFGTVSGLPNPFNLEDINGLNGFTINGASSSDLSGRSVSNAGDVNGDGTDDLIIGASSASPNGNSGAGASYLVFGSDTGLPNPLNLDSLNGVNGIIINGIAANDNSGTSVSSAGDINDDGFDDVIIGAPFADPSNNLVAGSSYVVFGAASGIPNPFNLDEINGLNGFTINGAAAGDQSGISVSGAGDINGDGIDDVIIGANLSNSSAGSSYVVFGTTSGFPNPLKLEDINGINGFSINGVTNGDQSGTSVSAAGDVNGDGTDDLIIGAYLADSSGGNDMGSSYVVFGTDSGLPNPFDLDDINGLNGFIINGESAGDYSGLSVHSAGDMNGDGIDDLIIGAPLAGLNNNDYSGSSYVIFGSTSQFSNPFNLIGLNGSNGFAINGVAENDLSGVSVSEAGDFNSDGIGDVIIGARAATPGGNAGAGSSYVVFGKEKPIFKDGFD